jgi:uroporphyrinogen III methyltransferase/synthase
MSQEAGPARPLAGRRILVTRRPEQSAELRDGLAALGAQVTELPAIEIAPPEDVTPLDRALLSLHLYDWVVFTSANAVNAVAERMEALGLHGRGLSGGASVASVGSSTTDAILERFPGTEIALQPIAGFRAEGLIEAFRTRGVRGQRFLLPVSDRARDALARALLADGGDVETVTAYRTTVPAGLRARVQEILSAGVDLATFASPSAVENLAVAAGAAARGLPAAVIGPVTEAAARAAGLDVRVTADPSTAAGLVDAIARHFARATSP